MTTSRLAGGSVVALVLAVLLAGCGGSKTPREPAGATDSGSVVSEFSSPPTEGSGPETPQSQQNGGPSITVVSLPVGGDGEQDPDHPDQQCASVNWRLGPLPAGVVIQQGTITLVPSGIFKVGGSGCGADQPQCGRGLRWTDDHTSCSVSVIQRHADSDAAVTVEVAGRIRCPSRQVCDLLAAQLNEQPGSQVVVTAIPHETGSPSESPSSPSGESTSSTGS